MVIHDNLIYSTGNLIDQSTYKYVLCMRKYIYPVYGAGKIQSESVLIRKISLKQLHKKIKCFCKRQRWGNPSTEINFAVTSYVLIAETNVLTDK